LKIKSCSYILTKIPARVPKSLYLSMVSKSSYLKE